MVCVWGDRGRGAGRVRVGLGTGRGEEHHRKSHDKAAMDTPGGRIGLGRGRRLGSWVDEPSRTSFIYSYGTYICTFIHRIFKYNILHMFTILVCNFFLYFVD